MASKFPGRWRLARAVTAVWEFSLERIVLDGEIIVDHARQYERFRIFIPAIKDFTIALFSVGFDPYLGFFHKPRYGRPSLALDLMEEFRPLIADSVVLTVINNGELGSSDFISAMGGVALTPGARKHLLGAYERRLAQEIIHPVFGYRISYRRVLEVQARLLGRYLMGEIRTYPSFLTR